ncbi:ATP-binding cassette domain-containing protein [Synechococcus sp. UW140]|uniref:ABC transporter ATP-binding protein n=1 Tax=Synechococcus sp. UW140 TaxID=368503 RepID=UPI003137A22F
MTKSRAAFNHSHLPVVELRGVSLNRGSRRILSDLHLQLMPGERLAIVGPSGAGKTTILRMLAGLELPTAGELLLFGEPQRYLRLDQNHPPDVRLVSQSPALLASLSVLQNVGFLLYRDGRLGEAEIKRRVARCLDAVGLAGTEEMMPAELSGGMQKRVSFARAMVDDPGAGQDFPLLLFDEPTAGLDPVASTRIEDLMGTTTRVANGTSVVVSHVLSTIERAAERVVLLYEAELRWQGSVEEFRCCTDPYVVQFRTGSLSGPMQPKELYSANASKP